MGGRAPAPSLGELRSEIARLDHALVRVVATRLRLARRAIRARQARGAGPTDAVQERRVRSRARRWATEAGVSVELIDALLGALIEAGKRGPPPAFRPDASLVPIRTGPRSRLGSASAEPAPRAVSSLETVLRTLERAELAGHKVGESPSH